MDSEKLSIINEADQFGVTQTLRKHNLFHSVFRRWKESFNEGGISLRNYNGSQFIAGVVRQFLKDKGANQEFTHVATPEEIAYIEALHSHVQREVVEHFE